MQDPRPMMWFQLAYDGTDFHGVSAVPGLRTVVGTVDAALRRVGWPSDLPWDALSRTDAGVHARCLWIGCWGAPRWPAEQVLHVLAQQLPRDVRCLAVRTSLGPLQAKAKTYSYGLDLSRYGDPLVPPGVWRAPYAVSLASLAPLAAPLVGRLDFEGFRRRGETREGLVRQVHRAAWRQEGHVARFWITGEGCPYRGVRSLVGAMLAVARGAYGEDSWHNLLAGNPHPLGKEQAPAMGLTLEGVELRDPEGEGPPSRPPQ